MVYPTVYRVEFAEKERWGTVTSTICHRYRKNFFFLLRTNYVEAKKKKKFKNKHADDRSQGWTSQNAEQES